MSGTQEKKEEVEQTLEHGAGNVQNGNGEASGTKEVEVRLLSSYKPMTIRAKENTRAFFESVEKIVEERNLSTNDAASELIIEYLDTQRGTRVQAHAYESLVKDIELLKEENARLKEALEEQGTNSVQVPENGRLLIFPPKHLKLLETIARNRFKNERIRARYKLKEQEDIGVLLLNCIMTEEILLDHNNCFYTGFTKDQMKSFRAER